MEFHRLALPIGCQVDCFRIEAVLGKGGFGITYLAVDLQLGKRVAIKELLPDSIATRFDGLTVVPHSAAVQENWEWARERFLEEARTLATFSHPAIVGVHRLIEANGTVYIVMDYVEGESYEARLQRMGVERSEGALMAIIDPILLGLEEVHSKNLLHRDIKPENILIDRRGQPVLIDFGSARESVGKTMTMTSIVTHGYSPIEQYQTKGRMGPWTDIYALGAVMYRAITGKKPPVAPDRIDLDEIQSLSRNNTVAFSEELRAAVDWALRVRANERPQTNMDFRARLTRKGSQEAVPVRVQGAYKRPLRVRPFSTEKPAVLRSKAENGDAEAAACLGRLYFAGVGQGIEVDYVKARKWIVQAAKNGIPDAVHRLGTLLYHGLGVKADLKAAGQCFTAAAECERLWDSGIATSSNLKPILDKLDFLWSSTSELHAKHIDEI